jgi:hypothetical protein
MDDVKHPLKHLVRVYLMRRSRESTPPPAPEEIRRLLGWGVPMPAAIKVRATRN